MSSDDPVQPIDLPAFPVGKDFKFVLSWVLTEYGVQPGKNPALGHPWNMTVFREKLADQITTAGGDGSNVDRLLAGWLAGPSHPSPAHLRALVLTIFGPPLSNNDPLRQWRIDFRKAGGPRERSSERVTEAEVTKDVLKAYELFRKGTETLRPSSRAYYNTTTGIDPALPVVAPTSWIPAKPVAIAAIDVGLRKLWTERDVPAPIPSLRQLGNRTFSDFVAKAFPDVVQDNLFCYRLLKVDIADGLPLMTFGPSYYQQFVSSCSVLGFEWAQRYLRDQSNRPLPTDERLLRGPAGHIFDLGSRYACPGVSTITIIRNRRNRSSPNYFLMHKRNWGGAMDSPDSQHVVPAGQFQPHSIEDANHEREFSIEHNIFREFAEELLGLEFARDPNRTLNDALLTHPKVRPFYEAYQLGRVQLSFLGLGFDPLIEKPGLLCAMVIDANAIDDALLDFPGDKREGVPFEVPLDQINTWAHDRPKVIPDGVACLRLASRSLEHLISE